MVLSAAFLLGQIGKVGDLFYSDRVVISPNSIAEELFQMHSHRQRSPRQVELQNMSGSGSNAASTSSSDMEQIPSSMIGTESVVIDNLKKTFTSMFKPPVEAVKGVSLKIYPGEITAILGTLTTKDDDILFVIHKVFVLAGHNGAGKTTLFNMLTGMTSTTSGSAHIFGYTLLERVLQHFCFV